MLFARFIIQGYVLLHVLQHHVIGDRYLLPFKGIHQ